MSATGLATEKAVSRSSRLGALLSPDAVATTVVGRQHRERDWILRRMLAVADAAAFVLAVLLAGLISDRLRFSDAMWIGSLVPLWIALYWIYGLYGRDIRRVSHTTVDDLPALFHALLLGSIGLWAISRVLPVRPLEFSELALMAVLVLGASVLGRTSSRAIASRRMAPERVLMVGAGETAAALVARMRSLPHCGLEPVAALARRDGESAAQLELPGVGALGEADLDAVIGEYLIERVVVADDLNDDRLLQLVHKCQKLGVKLDLVPAVFGALGPAVAVDAVGGLTVLAVNPPVLSRSDRMAKRLLDIVGSSVMLVIALPIFASLALAIKLASPGPVFFRQERVGYGGRRFRLLKFRSMVVDAEAQREGLLALSKDPDWLHLDHDPRITPVGRFLRMTSLDELPQLWNVLKGDMSLVGPRPLIVEEDDNVDGWVRGRLDLTPGITGLWQVLGRTTIPFEEMVKLDYLYVTNWSLWGDVRLLLRTLPAVLFQRGAN